MRCSDETIEQLDGALAELARGEAGLRLHLGQTLEVMSRDAVFELGFSSSSAYALERCERGARWTEVARCMARRAEGLPLLRHAMATGKLSWSMGELVSRIAQPGDEARWLALAESRTVRQMRALIAEHRARATRVEAAPAELDSSQADAVDAELAEMDAGDMSCETTSEMCRLTCTVDLEDAWLFEATTSLLEHLGVGGADGMEALLAEAQGSLLALLPESAMELEALHGSQDVRRRCAQAAARWRDELEAFCERQSGGWKEANARRADEPEGPRRIAVAACLGMSPLERLHSDELDAMARRLARGLARNELELSRQLLMFHRMEGWRRLGYASEAQYARERLGLSRSSVMGRRSLALRLEQLPGIAVALGAGHVGVEAALLLARVATSRTELEWLERARKRTIKHLREEVMAALVAVRCSGEIDISPPLDNELDEFQSLERTVVSGRVCVERPPAEAPAASPEERVIDPAAKPRRAWLVTLASLTEWLEGGPRTASVQTSAGRVGALAGRVTLRLRMTREVGLWWRRLEALARPLLERGMSWLRFACLSLWRAWQRDPSTKMAYEHIYVRDRFRCTSPVCNRRDVTPHHLQFRSAGGSDDDYNTTSICTWCHLYGVHGGRIRAQGTADNIRWELGPVRTPCLVVNGRDRA